MRGRKPNEIAAGSSPIVTVPRPPAWLSADAKREWKRVAPILVERGHLEDADLSILANCCDAFGTMVAMARKIESEGATILNARGELKRNPATGIKNEAAIRHKQLCAELGLTPVSRARATFKAANDDDLSFLD